MKKVISIILALVTIMSICSLSFSSLAASKVTYQTTYQASETHFTNSYGMVYCDAGRLMSEYNNKIYMIHAFSKNFGGSYSCHFYLRGKTVYYEFKGTYYSASLDGSNKKTIKKLENSKLLGGYGSKLVISNEKDDYAYFLATNGKMTKLFFLPYSCPMNIFYGKLYYRYNDEQYLNTFDLETKKNTRRAFKFGYSYLFSKKYLYYINGNHNLCKMDSKGNRELVKTDVKEIFSATDGSTVMFRGLHYNEVYKATGSAKPVLIADEYSLNKALTKYDSKLFSSKYNTLTGLKGAFCGKGGKIFFVFDTDVNENLDTVMLIYDTKTKTFSHGIDYRDKDEITIHTNGSNIYIKDSYNGDYYLKFNLDIDSFTNYPDAEVTATVKNGKVNVNWSKIAKVTGYLIYKQTFKDQYHGPSKLELIGSVKGASTTKYVDSKVNSGSYYKYIVIPYKVVNSAMHEYRWNWNRTDILAV